MVRATSSLPTPLSPWISTVALVGAARPTAAITCFSAGALADHLVPDFDRLLQRPVLVAQPALVERVAQADEHALAGERLLDEIERALLGRLDRRADRAVAGDDDDRQRLVHARAADRAPRGRPCRAS